MMLINQLKELLKEPLPGREGQNKMATTVRSIYREIPADAKVACVLVLFYPKGDTWHIVLIQRVSNNNKNDRHSGQISFPGGKLEIEDPSLEAGALREAEEEIGVNAKDIELIGHLSELYIPVSNFKVYPFVGYLDYEPSFVPQASEVKGIIEVPFELLNQPETRKQMDMKFSKNIVMKNVPYFDVQGKVVWGATAMILSELLEVWRVWRATGSRR